MKSKTLTRVLTKIIVILIILLISLISFLGIHKKELNNWKNILPDYQLSKELSNIRIFSFTVDKSTKEVEDESTDENSNEVNTETTNEKTEETTPEEAAPEGTATEETQGDKTTQENATQENTTQEDTKKEEVPVNDEKLLTKANYKKSKTIIEERLKKFGITDAIVNVNEKTGDISVSVPFADITDYTVSLAGNRGNLEIIDSETKEVLITKKMIKEAKAYYKPSDSTNTESKYASYDVGVVISFTKEGQKKLNEITKKYIETMDENGEKTQKTVMVRLDDEDKYKTYFASEGQYTELSIPLYQNVSTEDMEEFNNKYNECVVAQTEINTESLPIVYTLSAGTFIESNMGKDFVSYLMIAGIAILALITIILIIRNKTAGIMMAIIELGFLAIHLLLIRAAAVSLTLSGIIMILFMAILNYMLLAILANKEKVLDQLEAFARFILNIIPFIIVVIVFVLSKDINLQSVGMVGIWAIFVLAYTLLASILLLRKENTKKNGVE